MNSQWNMEKNLDLFQYSFHFIYYVYDLYFTNIIRFRINMQIFVVIFVFLDRKRSKYP
ncbi:MAG: hypothetical protein JWP12_842 [Bacteroidetes bacterium]|nr:hypothetical protein [Bacteroidota bacterium]